MGNLHLSHHCCIQDSHFHKNDDKETINSKNEIEKEPFKIAGKLIETGNSFITEFSPSRNQSKQSNADN